MSLRQYAGIWLLIAMFFFLTAPLFRSAESLMSYVESEVTQTQVAFGPTIGGWVVDVANTIYTKTPLQRLGDSAASRVSTPERRKRSEEVTGGLSKLMHNTGDGYLMAIAMQTYVASLRMAIFLIWLMAVGPLLIAAAIDGLAGREVRRLEGSALRPAAWTLMGIIVVPVLVVPVLYLFLPFSITPLLLPGWAVLVALPLRTMLTHSQPLFAK